MKIRVGLFAASLAIAIGCGHEAPVTELDPGTPTQTNWRLVAAEELTPGQQEQLNRAMAAKDAMAGTMMGELKSELELGGPPGAVVVCRDMAPMIAEHVADSYGLAIGRTSHRLRNPANVAPEWATNAVGEGATESSYLAGPDGELGVVLPIMAAAPCLACHGQPEALDQDVRTALAESYPDDRAVGFSEGDLRGWFWIEVPAVS